MPLATEQSEWIYRFTAGAVPLPLPAEGQATPSAKDQLQEHLRMRQGKERVDEQALKELLVAKAITVLKANKEAMREKLNLKATTVENGKEKVQNVRDPKGQQHKAFDAAEAPQLKEAPKGLADAGEAYKILVDQSDILAAAKVERSYIDAKAGVIATRRERLFTDDEIQEELYTPLVRELVVPETLIAPKFSATQKMIDGSNEYYLNECQDKGKRLSRGRAEFAKGAINLASAITTTVISGLAPVKPGQEALAGSGALSKKQAATAMAMTEGIAALLTGTVDAADQIDDFRDSGDFSVPGYRAVMNSMAIGIGKLVAGSTGNMNYGLAVTDSILAASTATTLIAEFANWRKKGGEPPVAQIIGAIGDSIAAGFSAKSDLTSDAGASTAWAQAGAIVSASFTTMAKAQEKHLIDAIRKGDWKSVFEVLATAGAQASAAVPTAARFAGEYNQIDGVDPNNPEQTDQDKADQQFQQQQKLLKSTSDIAANVSKLGSSVEALGQEARAALAERLKLEGKPLGSAEEALAAIEKKFAERQEAASKEALAAQAEELESIQKTLDAERKAFQDSLLCLGSTNPDDAEYKSIAKLIAQLERDRAIWNGLNAMFGAGLGLASSVATASVVAAEVVPALKVAGQFVKFVANMKAAADRLSAFLDWKESRKDAASAVSPYATSVENFCANQGSQFTHYTIQAVANIIQAMLAVGDMTPYAPAFKAAGGAVAAAAATEELVFKFHKQQALRAAWRDTKEALEPRNKGNRKMALLVREINPTLAKYTIAYGALIERSPIAITAMNRIGLDRETLTRAGDGVKDVKDYLEKLYVDDNIVLGQLDIKPGQAKVPAPALNSKAWSLSHLIWSEKEGLATANPPEIVAHLALVEKPLKERAAKSGTKAGEKELTALLAALAKLETAFGSYDPRTESGVPHEAARRASEAYAELASATAKAVRMDLDTLKAEEATV